MTAPRTVHATKERLLDAAEEVLARAGYRAASLRAITARAGVNLAAANYHFGSKRGLLEAVFARRLRPFNEARLARIAAVRAVARQGGRPPSAGEVLAAIVESTLLPGPRAAGIEQFFSFIGRSFFDPDPTVRRAFAGYMQPTFEAMLAALAETLPGIPRGVLSWRLQFIIGAMARVQHLAREGAPSRAGGSRAVSAQDVARELTAFVEGGMQAPPGAPADRHPHRRRRTA